MIRPLHLYRALERASLSPAALARALGVHRSTVHRWMSLECAPSASQLHALAAVLDVDLAEIWSAEQ